MAKASSTKTSSTKTSSTKRSSGKTAKAKKKTAKPAKRTKAKTKTKTAKTKTSNTKTSAAKATTGSSAKTSPGKPSKAVTAAKRPRASRRPFRVGRSKTGFGLFATEVIEKFGFIAYYQGRKINNAEADRRGTRYLFELNSRWTIDGANRRNLARYINHSCNANAESDVKKGKIIITARKAIQPDEEITIDYGSNYFDTFIKAKGCKCAACTAKSMVRRSAVKRGTA